MIEVRDLRKRFGTVQALDGVGFVAPEGRITGLLGPNGAGKTTTQRILYTVLSPDSGRALVDGFDSHAEALEVRRRIGVLPDAKGLYPRLTARENMRYYGRLQGLEGGALEASIDRLVRLFEMEEFADRRTAGFSTGQRVKVAIGRALVHEPPNVLLDEPTAGLDIMSTRAMRSIVRRLRDEGRTVLLSSHVMQEVSILCDHVVIIDHGRVVAAGSPDELRAATGRDDLEEAFIATLGTDEGLR